VDGLATKSPGMFYLLQGPTGHVLAGNMEHLHPASGVRTLTRTHRLQPGQLAGGIRGRGVVLANGSYLFVGVSDFELDEMQEVIGHAFLWGAAATILLALGGGVATSLAVLRRVESISATSREIMRGDLARRIVLRGSGDEFDHLASSLNAMLDRIQALMSGLQQVSNDIAHDLRTPLTRLRQRLELARQRETNMVGLQEAVDSAIEQTESILDSFAALLRIAQIEAGARKAGFVSVDLSILLQELVDVYQPVAEEKEQALSGTFMPALRVCGDRELLIQLFANLLENAIRHSPPGAKIRVHAISTPAGVRAEVADTGTGIPPASRDKVLQRFVRLEASRTTPGSGLGLSLVVAIAALHEAPLQLLDNAPGLRCVLDFRSC
jgi:signal transduction histidine kinase